MLRGDTGARRPDHPLLRLQLSGVREEIRDQLASEQELDNARKKIAFDEKTNRLALQPADD